jgi:hypothetical protein
MLVLENPEQGTDKSSALRVLAVDPEWFSDNLPLGLSARETIEAVAGRWIIEVSELQGMRKSDIGRVKAFQSRDTDRARTAYARTVTDARRQCIIIGTTNELEYLRDLTGNRRWWPVSVGRFDLEALRRDRDQLWAEAAAREATGVSIRLPEHLWAVAAKEQSERTIENPLTQPLSSLLKNLEGKVTTENLWRGLGIPIERQPSLYSNLGNAMQDLGWKRDRFRVDGGLPLRGYAKGEEPRKIIRCCAPDRQSGIPGSAEYDTDGEKPNPPQIKY